MSEKYEPQATLLRALREMPPINANNEPVLLLTTFRDVTDIVDNFVYFEDRMKGWRMVFSKKARARLDAEIPVLLGIRDFEYKGPFIETELLPESWQLVFDCILRCGAGATEMLALFIRQQVRGLSVFPAEKLLSIADETYRGDKPIRRYAFKVIGAAVALLAFLRHDVYDVLFKHVPRETYDLTTFWVLLIGVLVLAILPWGSFAWFEGLQARQ